MIVYVKEDKRRGKLEPDGGFSSHRIIGNNSVCIGITIKEEQSLFPFLRIINNSYNEENDIV